MQVLIADDHAIVRRGVREILEEAPLGIAVDETSTASATLKAIRDKAYEIVLLDVSFPDGSGLDVLREISASRPSTRVLLLSMYPEEHYAQRALRSGAAGYLSKDRAPEELIVAIRTVVAGGKYITQSLAEHLADEIGAKENHLPHETLSDRELQIMTRLAAGKSVGEIATELALSPKTISTYRTRVLEKLNLKTTAELIRYALENRLGN
jgi:two-component system, NarL family, invasion response regulator UvrY